jgi:hypothetical protein
MAGAAPLSRWGGAILAIGTIAYTSAVVLYLVVYGQATGTGPGDEVLLADRIAHYQGHQGVAHIVWFVELLAAVLLAVAGLVLRDRAPGHRTSALPRVAWSAVSVGGVLLCMTYPIMLGGYPTASSEAGVTLFDTLNSIATLQFYVGNVVLGAGFAAALFAEAVPGGVLPKWLALVGSILFIIWTIAAIGLIAGVGAMAAAAPLGLIGFLLTAFFGFSLWRKSA